MTMRNFINGARINHILIRHKMQFVRLSSEFNVNMFIKTKCQFNLIRSLFCSLETLSGHETGQLICIPSVTHQRYC